jgi:hypothetical protein
LDVSDQFIAVRGVSVGCAIGAVVWFASAPTQWGDTGNGFVLIALIIASVGAVFGLIVYLGAPTARERRNGLVSLLACVGSPLVFYMRVLSSPVQGGRRDEAYAIGDTRTVISAEAAYQSANSGFYGTITCLSTPASCIPDYTGPSFLDYSLGQTTVIKDGYRRQWFQKRSTSGPTPGSIDDFCYAATPEIPNRTGVRSFGGDSSGMIGQTIARTEDPPTLIETLLHVGRGTASHKFVCCKEARLDTAACPPLK